MKKKIDQSFRNIDCIYALRKNREVVYVGITSNLYVRALEHINNGKDFDDLSCVLISKNRNSKEYKEVIEQLIISEFKPKLNKLMTKSAEEYLNLIPYTSVVNAYKNGKKDRMIEKDYSLYMKDHLIFDANICYELLCNFDYENDVIVRTKRIQNETY